MTLRADELTRIRATATGWLTATCTIKRADGGQTSDGFEDTTPTTVASNVACRVDPISQRRLEQLVAAGVTSTPGYTIVLPHDTAEVKSQDVLIVGTRRYQVVAADPDRTILGCVTVNAVRLG